MPSKFQKMVKTLDDLAGTYVKLRDDCECQRCRATESYIALDPSHVITRDNKRLRWFPANIKTLCRGCHGWWHAYPEEALGWFERKFPMRWLEIEEEKLKGIKKWNLGELQDLKAWFEREIEILKEFSEQLPF